MTQSRAGEYFLRWALWRPRLSESASESKSDKHEVGEEEEEESEVEEMEESAEAETKVGNLCSSCL